MEITVLCKVVDNFGDIGVVWRLCRRLKFIKPELSINLVVDDLIAFNKICHKVQISEKKQIVNDIEIYDWKEFDFCYSVFKENDGEKLTLILECFQCGRPDWMEKILFEDKLNRTVQIIMIDYLTAEDYAEDFHCLQSLTRSGKVKKVNFMPGFTNKTGGLIIDSEWNKEFKRNKNGPLLIFTYERDWSGLIEGLIESDWKNQIFVAQGRGCESLLDAAKNKIQKNLKPLEYLDQNEWDEMTKNCSALIIRGEESMSRACLSGIPFIWHAYPQSDEYQIVKVEALLKKLKPYFSEENFTRIRNVWLSINQPFSIEQKAEEKKSVVEFFSNIEEMEAGFQNFAADLRKNGDLCCNLMTFIDKLSIIKY